MPIVDELGSCCLRVVLTLPNLVYKEIYMSRNISPPRAGLEAELGTRSVSTNLGSNCPIARIRKVCRLQNN